MKAKVIIENGESEIILVPENEFEIDLIEKIHMKKEKYNTITSFNAEYKFGDFQNHKIIIDIKEIK
jgi:hypothetical protein